MKKIIILDHGTIPTDFDDLYCCNMPFIPFLSHV